MSGISQHYKTLELENGASLEEVKQAYKDLALVWHPDRFPNNARLQQKAEDKLKEINKAYEQLRLCQSSHRSRAYSPSEQTQRPPHSGYRQDSGYREDKSKPYSNQKQGASQHSKRTQGPPQSGPGQGQATSRSQSDQKRGASQQSQQCSKQEGFRSSRRGQYNPTISLQEAKAILTEYKFKWIRNYPDGCICYESGPFCLDIREDVPEVVLSVPCDSVSTFHRALLSIPCKSVGTFHQSEARELIDLFRSSASES